MKLILSKTELKKLQKREVIVNVDEKYYLKAYDKTEDNQYCLLEVEVQQKSTLSTSDSIFSLTQNYTKDNVETWIDTFRKLWSEKAGPTAGYRNLSVSRMIDFLNNNDVEIEEVFKARDLYFESIYSKHGNYKYLQHAENFINKYSNQHGMNISNLFRFIEAIRSGVTDASAINENLTYDDI